VLGDGLGGECLARAGWAMKNGDESATFPGDDVGDDSVSCIRVDRHTDESFNETFSIRLQDEVVPRILVENHLLELGDVKFLPGLAFVRRIIIIMTLTLLTDLIGKVEAFDVGR
jgi:hypothetical protein